MIGPPFPSRRRASSSTARGERPLDLLAWAQLGWLVVALGTWSILLLTLPLDPDYTAGELLDHLHSWRETGVLYPALGALPPLRVLNYPPLVPMLARGLAGLGLPALAAGRLANDLGALAALAGVAWWSRARGARGAALAGTVGLLGASFPFLYGAGQLHVEMGAVAGVVWGFALLDRGRGRRGAALAGVALALACFAKQTEVVPALAALGWAWARRREAAPWATAAFVGLGAVGSAAITAAWGIEPWRHMLAYTVGTFSLANLGFQALSHAAPWAVLLALAARTALRAPRAAAADGAFWYWAVAALWALSAARVGSSFTYFLDLHLATAVWVGPRLFGGEGAGGATAAAPLGRGWTLLLALQVLGGSAGAGAALAVDVRRLRRAAAELPALCARLETAAPDGAPLITEEAGVARACGRSALFHPFILTSLAEQGRWDPGALERAIAAGSYPALLPFDPRAAAAGAHAERWSAADRRAFARAPRIEALPAGRWLVRWR